MNPEVKILMIDDIPSVYQSLKNDAIDYGIDLHYAQTTDDAEEILRSSIGIVGVIIDAIGLIKKGEKSGQGKEKGSFLLETIRRIDYLEKEEKIYYAKCVYTAHYDRFVGIVPENILVFSKLDENGVDKNEMFRHILNEIQKNDFHRISRTVFPDVFNAMNSPFFKENQALFKFYSVGFSMSDAFDRHFYSLLIKTEKSEYGEELYNICRKILEYYFVSLRDLGLPSILYSEKGVPEQAPCINYIRGRDVYRGSTIILNKESYSNEQFPEPIQYSFEYLKNITNKQSHLTNGFHSKYLLISVSNCFIEILMWLSKQKSLKSKKVIIKRI
jgi:hypothetical protein